MKAGLGKWLLDSLNHIFSCALWILWMLFAMTGGNICTVKTLKEATERHKYITHLKNVYKLD